MRQCRLCGPEGSVRCQTLSRNPEVFIRLCGVSKYKNLCSPNERTAPPDHPLALEAAELAAQGQVLSLARLAEFPIISYETGYTGRSHIDAAFRAAGLHLDVVPVAMDADEIKTCVELGLGVGIVAAIA